MRRSASDELIFAPKPFRLQPGAAGRARRERFGRQFGVTGKRHPRRLRFDRDDGGQ
jgi:hypothetical protein